MARPGMDTDGLNGRWTVSRDGGARRLVRAWPVQLPRSAAERYGRLHKRLLGLTDAGILPGADPKEELRHGACIVRHEQADWLEPGRISKAYSERQVSGILLQIARAVSSLHAAGIMMTELSPRNVLFSGGTREPDVLLADFVTATMPGEADGMDSLVLIEPEYASPEARRFAAGQTSGKPLWTSDVFSMGMLFHLYLTGALPAFEAYDPNGIPEGKAKLSRKLTLYYRDLIAAMLEIDPDRRPQSASDVAGHLQRICLMGGSLIRLIWKGHEGEILTVSAPGGYRAWKRLDENGEAVFGPLLADAEYSLSHQTKVLTMLRFPDQKGWQQIMVSLDRLHSREEKKSSALPVMPKAETGNAVELNPPLNNIMQIELLPDGRCRLMLINRGTFCIRKEDADRYGIRHILDGISDR